MTRFFAALVALLVTAGPAGALPAAAAQPQRVVLAGGCFWGMQLVFESLKGVRSTEAGYAGGNAATAHYEIVSTGTTGQAESVEITYDPSIISFKQLLDVYFRVAHDPTELNRQGPDDGTQYRSEILTRPAISARKRSQRSHGWGTIASFRRRSLPSSPRYGDSMPPKDTIKTSPFTIRTIPTSPRTTFRSWTTCARNIPRS